MLSSGFHFFLITFIIVSAAIVEKIEKWKKIEK